ncbi:MAG: dihydroorotate dehydrogenase-like protein [Planctomycetes bacterium]|nr:dihydroorotate dehydrogenase-like protein [Planctomycetota bacterium]
MDLSTTYMGLKLKHPVVPAAGPLSHEIGTIRQLEDAGAAAVVLHSLFEEQISAEAAELDHHLSHGTDSFAEALSYFPDAHDYKLGPEEYLEHVAKAKTAVDVPIIASLNGASHGGWIDYAKRIEQAGADALELNVYFLATDPELDSAAVEQRYIDILQAVKQAVKIPVAIKLGPFFSAFAWMACRLDKAGADALVLFNRFYQPDIDLEKLEVVPDLVLSSPFDMRLPLRWAAILYGKVEASLASTRGVVTGQDVVKLVMAGVDVVQVCSSLLRNGPGHIGKMLTEMKTWLEENEYESVEQMKGSMSQKSCPNPAAFERANYMKTLHTYAGRC